MINPGLALLFECTFDLASGALDASKSAASSVAGTVRTAAHSASSAAVAAAEKLTGKDLNKGEQDRVALFSVK